MLDTRIGSFITLTAEGNFLQKDQQYKILKTMRIVESRESH